MVEENFFFLYRALVLQEGTDFLDPGWGPCFHFALDPANYIADPGYGSFWELNWVNFLEVKKTLFFL